MASARALSGAYRPLVGRLGRNVWLNPVSAFKLVFCLYAGSEVSMHLSDTESSGNFSPTLWKSPLLIGFFEAQESKPPRNLALLSGGLCLPARLVGGPGCASARCTSRVEMSEFWAHACSHVRKLPACPRAAVASRLPLPSPRHRTASRILPWVSWGLTVRWVAEAVTRPCCLQRLTSFPVPFICMSLVFFKVSVQTLRLSERLYLRNPQRFVRLMTDPRQARVACVFPPAWCFAIPFSYRVF